MTNPTKAEVFIRTVAELRDEHRERRGTQQRLQERTKAEKFVQAFPAARGVSDTAPGIAPGATSPQEKPGQHPASQKQAEEISQLLRDGRIRQLRASDTATLRRLISVLERACEATRAAALSRILASRWQVDAEGDKDSIGSFADLYAALRRARIELRRREVAPTRAAQAAVRHGAKPCVAERAPPDRTTVASPWALR